MHFTTDYNSPIGKIFIASDEESITGLWFVGQKYFAYGLDKEYCRKAAPVLKYAKKWLDIYFSGKNPDFSVPIRFTGTDFQNEVWKILCSIPYGETVTYKEIAEIIAKNRNISRMSAQAVGGAVGKNSISIIVPCHRVIGTDGNLTGYAGGIEKKISLLKLENAYKSRFYIPTL